MRLLYTLNALESGPNDFKLITPSKYIVGKVGGGQAVTSVMGGTSCQLESREFLPVVDICLLLLLLLGGSRSESGEGCSSDVWSLETVSGNLWRLWSDLVVGRNATGRSTHWPVCNNYNQTNNSNFRQSESALTDTWPMRGQIGVLMVNNSDISAARIQPLEQWRLWKDHWSSL